MKAKKVALVTGVSSGICRATANLLARSGYRVFGTSRRPQEADGAAGAIEMVALDVRDEGSVRECVRGVLERAGRLDALVNNAGYALFGAAEETSVREAQELFDTNFFGVLRVTQQVLPAMRSQGGGRIAIIGSVAGFLPTPYQAIYSASKHALEGYAESLDHEVRQFGVRVSILEPGFMRTNIAANSRVAAQPVGAYDADRQHVYGAVQSAVSHAEEPETVAAAVLQALNDPSPRLRYAVGRQAKYLRLARSLAPQAFFAQRLREQFGLDAK